MGRTLTSLLIILLSMAGFSKAWAAQILEIPKNDVKVYAQPNMSSQVLTTINQGQKVKVSRVNYPGFKKILVENNGQRTIGFVSLRDLGPASSPQMRQGHYNRGRRLVRRRRHGRTVLGGRFLGIFAGMNYNSQGARTFSDPSGDTANIGTLSGIGYQLGFLYEFRFNRHIMLRPYLEYKSISISGNSTYSNSSFQNAPASTALTESFVTLGLMGKYYSNYASYFWWGAGLQLDHAISGQLTFGSFPATSLGGSDLPNFVYGYLSSGYDFPVGHSFFLTPEVRLGGMLNALPIILEGDIQMTLMWRF